MIFTWAMVITRSSARAVFFYIGAWVQFKSDGSVVLDGNGNPILGSGEGNNFVVSNGGTVA
jgi:hypothetical protein